MRKLFIVLLSMFCLSGWGQDINILQFNNTAVALSTNLVSFWPASETSGTNLDDPVGGHDMTINSVDWSSGMVFNATSDYAGVAHNDALSNLGQAFSISMWVTLASLPSIAARDFYLYAQRNTATPYGVAFISIPQTDNKILFTVYSANGNNYIKHNVALEANILYHVVCTYNGANLKIYVNNVENSFGAGTLTGNVIHGAGSTYIGSANGTTLAPNGTIRSVGIWTKVLSMPEIAVLYNNVTPLNYPF